jgi:3-hydroxyacyl-CoA dehydrogenase
MTEFDQAEFWEALGRLYNSTVTLKDATEALARTAQAHEKRLDRVEVTVEAILEDLRQHREGLQ